MAYQRSNLIARPSAVGAWNDIVSNIGSAIGAAFKSTPATPTTTTVVAPSSGMDTTTMLVIGALGVGAVLLLLRKKKAKAA